MRSIYVARRDALASMMDEYLDYVCVHSASGGMQMPCHLKHGISEKEITAAARRAGVDILRAAGLYAGPPLHRFFDGICCLHGKGNRRRCKKTGRNFPSCLMPSTGQRRILIPGEQGHKQDPPAGLVSVSKTSASDVTILTPVFLNLCTSAAMR
jgi:hypothetical protein